MTRTLDGIARVCHETNRAYCCTIGDFTQPSWDEAPDWARSSAVNGVKFRLENPTSTPADSHANWLAEKIADGWVHGVVKDPAAKKHPCIVESYADLPHEQRTKDALFIGVVDAMMTGYDREALLREHRTHNQEMQ